MTKSPSISVVQISPCFLLVNILFYFGEKLKKVEIKSKKYCIFVFGLSAIEAK